MNSQDRDKQDNEVHGGVRPLFVSIKTVALMCDIDQRTVYRRVKAGDMPPPVKIGHLTRWRLDELEQWCNAGCPSVGNSEGSEK